MLEARVVATRWEAPGIVSFELAGAFPAWEPGAHIDVHLPSGAVRQYSLCGSGPNYRIAVLAQPSGRGGSVEVHRELRAGTVVEVSEPRCTFGLVEAARYVFVAGGIGITPLLPMVRAVAERGAPWELIYGAGSASHHAFAAELRAAAGPVTFAVGRLDLAGIVERSVGAAVYACGPGGMLDELAELMAGRAVDLHVERFAPPPVDAGGEFDVELARSGIVVPVGADETVLDAVRAAGVDVASSCEMGICGTCETKVLAGVVDHRDDLLTASERAAATTMMPCVSRAITPRLVLDL